MLVLAVHHQWPCQKVHCAPWKSEPLPMAHPLREPLSCHPSPVTWLLVPARRPPRLEGYPIVLLKLVYKSTCSKIPVRTSSSCWKRAGQGETRRPLSAYKIPVIYWTDQTITSVPASSPETTVTQWCIMWSNTTLKMVEESGPHWVAHMQPLIRELQVGYTIAVNCIWIYKFKQLVDTSNHDVL